MPLYGLHDFICLYTATSLASIKHHAVEILTQTSLSAHKLVDPWGGGSIYLHTDIRGAAPAAAVEYLEAQVAKLYLELYIRLGLHPLIVTTRGNGNHINIRVLLFS